MLKLLERGEYLYGYTDDTTCCYLNLRRIYIGGWSYSVNNQKIKAVKQANSEDVKKFAVVTGIVYILGDIAIGAIYSVMALIPDFSKLDMAGTICFIPIIAVTIIYAIAENTIIKKK